MTMHNQMKYVFPCVLRHRTATSSFCGKSGEKLNTRKNTLSKYVSIFHSEKIICGKPPKMFFVSDLVPLEILCL